MRMQTDVAFVHWLVDKRYSPVNAASIFGWTAETKRRFEKGFNENARFVEGGNNAMLSKKKRVKRKKPKSSLEAACKKFRQRRRLTTSSDKNSMITSSPQPEQMGKDVPSPILSVRKPNDYSMTQWRRTIGKDSVVCTGAVFIFFHDVLYT